MKPSHEKHGVVAILVASLLVGGAFMGGAVATIAIKMPGPQGQQAAALFPNPVLLPEEHLTARSAIIYDIKTGKTLFTKNPSDQLPLASLTKLMTAEVVLSNRAANTPVTITEQDLEPYGDWGLKVGDTIPLHDLLKFGLIASSNDAMAAAANALGNHYLGDMNQAAKALGLKHTYFLNPTGLDVTEDTAGAYSTVGDMAKLAAMFYKIYPDYFTLTTQPSVSIQAGDRTLSAKATALPILTIPGFLGAKTGFTDLAGGNLVAIFDLEIGHPVVAVVLGSTEQGRFHDIRTLIEATQKAQSL